MHGVDTHAGNLTIHMIVADSEILTAFSAIVLVLILTVLVQCALYCTTNTWLHTQHY